MPFTKAALLGFTLIAMADMLGVRTTIASAASAGANEIGQPEPPARVGLANPAAVFCVKSGGVHAIGKSADGSEDGVCVFPDGREVNAWEFFRAHAPKH